MRLTQEHGRKCSLCKRRRPSRLFFKQVEGRDVRLCKECWAKQIEGDPK